MNNNLEIEDIFIEKEKVASITKELGSKISKILYKGTTNTEGENGVIEDIKKLEIKRVFILEEKGGKE